MTRRDPRVRWTTVHLAGVLVARLAPLLAVVLTGLAFVLATAAPAEAHASLVSTDPTEGAVLTSTPDVVTFTFDETIRTTGESIRVFDAHGEPVDAASGSNNNVLTADLPDHLTDGTYVVVWQVISADSHPVGGSLTFSIGQPSLTVTPPPVGTTAPTTGRTPLSIAQGITYLGLLTAGGLTYFTLWIIGGIPIDPRAGRRLRRARQVSTAIAVTAGAAVIPLTVAYQRNVDATALASVWAWDLARDPAVVFSVQALGLAAALLVRSRTAATIAAGTAVLAPALIGHSRAFDPTSLVLFADAVHLIAGAVWLGGLIGLVLTLRPATHQPAATARILARFSTAAATVLGLLLLTGSFASWRILGSWDALVHTRYGIVLLAKVILVASAVAVAAVNRCLLLPRTTPTPSHASTPQAERAVGLVRHAVGAEAVALTVVLLLTGFLVNLSPQRTPVTRRPAASKVHTATASDHKILATLVPAHRGPNTLAIQIQDATGEPVTTHRAPTISVTSPTLDLGHIPTAPTANGTNQARIIIPTPGTWTVQVSVSTSQFDNPVTTLRFTVS